MLILLLLERRAKEREINPSARVITHAARNRVRKITGTDMELIFT